MKALATLLLAFLLPGLCLAQSSIRLLGVVNVLGKRTAVLEVSGSRPPFGPKPVTIILSENEREGDLEVTAVDLARATVQARFYGTNCSLTFTTAEISTGFPVQLANVPLSVVLKLYAELTGLTLLQHPELPEAKLSITSALTNRPTLATVLGAALTNAGVVGIPDGEKFLQLVPQHLADKIQPRSQKIRPANLGGTAEANWPAGSVNLISAPLLQVTKIYASFVNREFDPDSIYVVKQRLPDVVFKQQTSLTKAEMIYAFDVQLAWRGVKMVAVDDQRIRLAPLNEQ